jgi:prolipoprotein diacylglyceryl transferase
MSFSLYGLIIGIGFLVSFSLSEHILKTILKAKPSRVNSGQGLAFLAWMVFAGGLIGARAYHVFTDWPLYQARPLEALFIWRGGLGIYGAIAGGLIGLWISKRLSHLPWSWPQLLDAAFISIPFGQAIGRWGNFINQELYGPPTKLPWGIVIDAAHRLPGYAITERYHPLFLYESIADLMIGLGLFWLWRHSRRGKVQFPQLGSGTYTGLYLISYGLVRFSLELLRLESAPGPLGLTVAQWVSLGLVVVGWGWLARAARRSISGVLAALLFGLSLLFFPPAARAQQTAPWELSISPSVVEIAVQPGKFVTQAFLLENSGTFDLEVTPTLRDFTSDGQTGYPVILNSSTFPYAGLQNADRQLDRPFAMPANSSQQLVLSLDIPDDAARRDWYFVFLLSAQPAQEGQLADSGAQARGAVAANVLVRVTADNLEPLSWNLRFLKLPRFLDSLQTLIIRPFIENASQTMAAPDLAIVVLDWRNNIVYEQPGLPDRVLAGSSREIFAAQTRRDDPRSATAAPFAFDPLFAFGPYRVRATIRNAQTGPVIVEETVTAWPFSLVMAGTLLGLTLIYLRRRHNRLTQPLA